MTTIFGGHASKYRCAKCCIVILTFHIGIPEADSIMLRTGFYHKNNLQTCSWGMNDSFETNILWLFFFFQLLWAHHYRGPKWVQVSMNKRYLLLPGLTFIIPRLATGLFFADWQYCPQVFHSLFKKNHKKNIQWVNAWVTRFKPGHHGECNPECSHRGQKKICPLTRFNSQKGKLRTEILAFQYFVV